MIWDQLLSQQSSADKGTLWQLRNLINRTAVPLEPKANVKAAEDFLQVVLTGYVVVAARAILQTLQTTTVEEVSKSIVESFCTIDNIGSNPKPTPGDDCVQAYSKKLMTLGLVWLGFDDAIKEGDGDRVLRYWKFLLLLFKMDNRRNYSCEAAKLLLDYQYFLSPRQAAQLKWSRFVNTHGRKACNIPGDLHLEHLNHRVKNALAHLGSNVTLKAVDRIGKAIGAVNHVCSTFENQMIKTHGSERHAGAAFGKDLTAIVTCLEDAMVFNNIAGRKHRVFTFTATYLERVDLPRTITWIKEQYMKYAPQ